MGQTVYVVDDDPDVLNTVTFVLENQSLKVVGFATPAALLNSVDPESRGCLLLNIPLPGVDGLELQHELKLRKVLMPIIFYSEDGNIPLAVQAVNGGALDFLEKPFREDQLLDRVQHALRIEHVLRRGKGNRAEVEGYLKHLTPREREVMEGILQGKTNKTIALEMSISVRTVEVHRFHLLEKLKAKNSSDMVRMVLSTDSYRDWLF